MKIKKVNGEHRCEHCHCTTFEHTNGDGEVIYPAEIPYVYEITITGWDFLLCDDCADILAVKLLRRGFNKEDQQQ